MYINLNIDIYYTKQKIKALTFKYKSQQSIKTEFTEVAWQKIIRKMFIYNNYSAMQNKTKTAQPVWFSG